MTVSTRPPWSDNRKAQTNETTSGIGGDEPLDDDRSVLSPGPILSPESLSSPWQRIELVYVFSDDKFTTTVWR